MDTLNLIDKEPELRNTIKILEAKIADSNKSFFYFFDIIPENNNEKENRLISISPSDQCAMFASVMLYLWDMYGKNIWLKRFYEALSRCPESNQDKLSSSQSSINWIVSVSYAAKRNLLPLFMQRWNLPDERFYKFLDQKIRSANWNDKLDFEQFLFI